MPEHLQLDARIYNPYQVEDLETSHPAVFTALNVWFEAIRHFEDGPLNRLIGARSAADIERFRADGEAVLARVPAFAANLDPLITALEAAMAKEPAGPAKDRLQGLLEAARHNRSEWLERAPRLVAQAIASAKNVPAVTVDAEALLTATTTKLEKLAAESASDRKKFAELQPLIEQLRRTWADLDAGLASLPRQEAKLLRRAHQARMGAAASALCRNVMNAKMRDRASGLMPGPKIELKADTLPDRFAVAILRADYTAACALMAPWLRETWTPDTLRKKVEEECASIASGFNMETPPPPADYEVGSSASKLADLRSSRHVTEPPIPPEVNEENFVAWIPVTIMPDEEDSYLTDIGTLLAPCLITVKEGGEERIGYLWFGEE